MPLDPSLTSAVLLPFSPLPPVGDHTVWRRTDGTAWPCVTLPAALCAMWVAPGGMSLSAFHVSLPVFFFLAHLLCSQKALKSSFFWFLLSIFDRLLRKLQGICSRGFGSWKGLFPLHSWSRWSSCAGQGSQSCPVPCFISWEVIPRSPGHPQKR